MKYALLTLILVCCCLTSDRSYSHINGGMPDSVAEMEYRILLDFEPENIEARITFAEVLLRLKKFSEADSEFRTVIAADPNNLRARLGLGQLMIHDKDYSGAEALFRQLQLAHADDGWSSYYIAVIYKETGKYKAAEALLTAEQKRVQTIQDEATTHLKAKIEEMLTEIRSLSSAGPAAQSAQ